MSQNVKVKGHRINKYGILGPRKIVRFTAEVECSETNNVNQNLLAYFVHYKTEFKRKLKQLQAKYQLTAADKKAVYGLVSEANAPRGVD